MAIGGKAGKTQVKRRKITQAPVTDHANSETASCTDHWTQNLCDAVLLMGLTNEK